jgi:hypothetical protein
MTYHHAKVPMTTGLKVVLSILIAIAGVVVMLGIAGVLIVRQIHVKESGTGDQKSVNIETPLGNMAVKPRKDLDPSSVGIPVYPGATRSDDRGGAEFQFDAGDFHKEFDVAGALYYTADPVDKVRQYYEQKFPDWKVNSGAGSNVNINGTQYNNGWHLETHDGNRVRTISVNSSEGRTRIAVASLGPPASN